MTSALALPGLFDTTPTEPTEPTSAPATTPTTPATGLPSNSANPEGEAN